MVGSAGQEILPFIETKYDASLPRSVKWSHPMRCSNRNLVSHPSQYDLHDNIF